MAANGETQLELDVMYGVSIQSSSLSGDNSPQQYEAPFAGRRGPSLQRITHHRWSKLERDGVLRGATRFGERPNTRGLLHLDPVPRCDIENLRSFAAIPLLFE